MSTVILPILTLIEVRGYPMYPGAGNPDGFAHTLRTGLNLIIGVNGLGKTTLLNILFRSLVGPYDPTKADRLEPGAKLHKRTELKRFDYFAARIGADARKARVTLELTFGKNVLRVVRNLGPTLTVEELRLNGVVLDEPSEQRFLEVIKDVSGIDTEYDWDFVVRNLLFFTEEKIPLIWNPKGQFEILRILFLNRALSIECAELHDQIMTEDSHSRNLGWQVTTMEQQIAETFDKLKKIGADATALPDLQREKETLAQEMAMYEKAEIQLTAEISEFEAQIFKSQIDLHDRGNELERARGDYFRKAFPGLPEVTDVVFGKLLAGEHCIVCSSPSGVGRERLERLLKEHQCPVCESKIKAPANVIAPSRLQNNRLRSLEGEYKKQEMFLSDCKTKKMTLESELVDVRGRLYTTLSQLRSVELRIERVIASSGEDNSEIAKAREILANQKRELERGRGELLKKRKQYERLLDKARRSIGAVADDVVRVFANYAREFILEDCRLTYRMHPRPIGQGGINLNFPSFQLEMTSAVLPIPTPRDESEKVSESQKEFIDLAFRMALLKVASSQGGGGLLVIETPEASLDSVFIDRAGAMLHQFAHGRGNAANQLVVTSNLNKENMIPALLGLKGQGGKIRRANQEQMSRIINLLELAAPSRAYKKFKKEYDCAFKEAIGH